MSRRKDGTVLDANLLRKLLFLNAPQQSPKITTQALDAVSFLVGHFITQARTRASMEAEFDTDAKLLDCENDDNRCNVVDEEEQGTKKGDDDDPLYYFQTSRKRLPFQFPRDEEKEIQIDSNHEPIEKDKFKRDDNNTCTIKEIQPHHILSTAAELLLDFT